MTEVNIVELVTRIIEPLLENPSELDVKVEEAGKFISITINSNPSDIGRIIGRQGKVINAIRTVVTAVLAKYGKKTDITIVDGNQDK